MDDQTKKKPHPNSVLQVQYNHTITDIHVVHVVTGRVPEMRLVGPPSAQNRARANETPIIVHAFRSFRVTSHLELLMTLDLGLLCLLAGGLGTNAELVHNPIPSGLGIFSDLSKDGLRWA